MFWTFYGAREDRRAGWPGKATPKPDQPRADRRSAPKTVEQLFFVIEEMAEINSDKPAPVAH
jgi:hypothetical protein